MKKIIIAGAFVVALVAGAAVALPVAEKYMGDNIKAQIDSAGFFSVGSVEVGLLDRRIIMNDMRARQAAGFSATRWEMSGLAWPLGELLRGRTPLSGYRLGDPLHVQRFEASGVRLTTIDGQSWSFGKIILEGVDLDRFDADLPPSAMQAMTIGARFIRAASVQRFEERDAVHSMPATGATVGFASLTGSKVDHGLFGTFELTALEASGKTAAEPAFRMQSLKGEGFDLRPIMTAMSNPTWRPGMPAGRLRVDRATATGFGGEALSRYGITLGSVSMDSKRESDTVRSWDFKVDGFTMVPPARGLEGIQARLVMQAMNLKELRLGLDCAGGEDRKKSEATIDRCVLSGPDLGELSLSARFVDADDTFWRAVDDGNMSFIYRSKIAFGKGKLTLADKGLLTRGAQALALTSHKTPAATRAELAAEIRRYAPPNVLITEDMTKLLDTVASFIEKGGTITLDAQPDPPLGVGKLALMSRGGPDIVGLMGLTATLSK